MKIDKAFKLIEKNIDEADFVGEIENEAIEEAEEILNLRFPGSYTKFLSEYGCGDIFGIEIFGIVSDSDVEAEGIPSVVWLTQNLRNDDGLKKQFVPVAETGDGPYYVLDTGRMNADNECPVLIWDPGDKGTEEAYPDFGTFLYEILDELQ